jgi:site-specific DNA-methyltransferase (adenine-specific)
LTSITDRFGKEGSAEAQYGKDGAFQRASKGFMGKSWDGGDISFQPETWKALGHLLYPGAFGMTFGGSRTAHRMAVAIEDAGFIIHPMIGWVYGSGFPKATRIDTQIDKEAGIEIEHGELISENVAMSGGNYTRDKKHKATTPDAQSWEGHRYGLQALKPALEPIIVFQKPYPKGVRPIGSITKTGAGALNIEQSRIGKDNMINPAGQLGAHAVYRTMERNDSFTQSQGRWPSNFVLTHSPDCQLIGYRNDSYQINRFTDGAKPFGDGAGHEFDSEEIESGTPVWDCVDGCPAKILGYEARFFHQSFYYQAKAGVSEREAGLRGYVPCLKCGALDSIVHIDIDDGEIRDCRRCIHPTIKPISLIRHLATLLLPPEAYKPRRLLVPFAGTGSEMIGAFQAGWECVIGIDNEKEYVDIGRARIKYWLEQGVQLELL